MNNQQCKTVFSRYLLVLFTLIVVLILSIQLYLVFHVQNSFVTTCPSIIDPWSGYNECILLTANTYDGVCRANVLPVVPTDTTFICYNIVSPITNVTCQGLGYKLNVVSKEYVWNYYSLYDEQCFLWSVLDEVLPTIQCITDTIPTTIYWSYTQGSYPVEWKKLHRSERQSISIKIRRTSIIDKHGQ